VLIVTIAEFDPLASDAPPAPTVIVYAVPGAKEVVVVNNPPAPPPPPLSSADLAVPPPPPPATSKYETV
jgi:hypothetical protein